MTCHGHEKLPFRSRLPLALSVVVAALLCLIPWSGTAVAHGSVVDPASRNYGCWLRWGSDFQNPAMAQQDPMCWKAWQHDPNAMWNWNGLYRNGSAGNSRPWSPTASCAVAGAPRAGATTPWTRRAPGRRRT
ncbi:hypothetical protein GCM10023238_39940 [Streptomyces heliomycini]